MIIIRVILINSNAILIVLSDCPVASLLFLLYAVSCFG